MDKEKSLYRQVVVSSSEDRTSPVTSRIYRGISTISNSSNSYALYDISLIKQDILNHFHIRKGEKLENPNFGTIIWDVLFEPLTEVLKNAIINDVTEIVNYDPRVTADSIVVTQYDSGIQIECKLTYLRYSISEQLQFKFDQDNSIV